MQRRERPKKRPAGECRRVFKNASWLAAGMTYRRDFRPKKPKAAKPKPIRSTLEALSGV